MFELKRVEDFNGNYNKLAAESSASGAGSRATMKNLNGVVVNLVSAVDGRKFMLGRDGMAIELKKQKP